MVYFVIDLPDPHYPFQNAQCLRTDMVIPDDSGLLSSLEGLSSFRLFVHEWNSFIHVAAKAVSFTWQDDRDLRP